MPKSMTGYGTADGAFGSARLAVEVRSVNHRFFNPSIKLPSELTRWEAETRDVLRTHVARGHVSVFARIERPAMESSLIDERRFGEYVDQLRRLQDRFNLGASIDVASVLRLPDVMSSGEPETSSDGTVEELTAVVGAAVAAMNVMRAAEGTRLAEYIMARLSLIEESVQRIDRRAPQRLIEHRDRTRAAVRELADGLAIDEQRLAQEVAILADRLDVAEEISRFHSHFAAFRETLATDAADGVGKRLGFLLQELLREANTTGSKGNDAEILDNVIIIKEELERIREQVENLE